MHRIASPHKQKVCSSDFHDRSRTFSGCCNCSTSHHITSHHITSHHITSHHITSHHIASHHITSHHIASHRITSHHITSYHITSHTTKSYKTGLLILMLHNMFIRCHSQFRLLFEIRGYLKIGKRNVTSKNRFKTFGLNIRSSE
jgi:hypothetical protein